jgi:histidinol-phosphate aminotransferase
LSVAAATASLADKSYIGEVRDNVAAERVKWIAFLDELHLQHTDSRANFVFFDIKKPYSEVAAKFKDNGITIGRLFPPYTTWIRITIGLPEENTRARELVRLLVK